MDIEKYIDLKNGNYLNYVTENTSSEGIITHLCNDIDELPTIGEKIFLIKLLTECIGYANGISATGLHDTPDTDFYSDLDCAISLKFSVLISKLNSHTL